MNRPPTPRPLDLDLLLRSVADEVTPRTDDATSAVLLRDGVRHVRRRRAVLVGAAAALAVAAAGVGANAVLVDEPRPVLPAPAPSPEPTPSPTHEAAFPAPLTRDALRCGSPAPAPTGTDLLATAAVDPAEVSVTSPEVVEVAGRATLADDARVSALDPAGLAGYVVVRDGVVVSSLVPTSVEGADHVVLAPRDEVALTVQVDSSASCDTDGVASQPPSLPPGDYELAVVVPGVVSSYAVVRDGSWGAPVTAPGARASLFDGWLVSPAVPFTVAAAPEAEEPAPPSTPDPVPGAFPGPTTSFPAAPTYEDLQCGMPAPAPTGDEVLARLDVATSTLAVTHGGETTLPARIAGLPTARTETVDFRWLRAYVVVQDGRIVSSTVPATDADGYVVLEPGATEPLDHVVSAAVACEWGMPSGTALPAGEYTVQAVHPWMITSYGLQQRDGSWGPENVGGDLYKGWLVSVPVRLTVS